MIGRAVLALRLVLAAAGLAALAGCAASTVPAVHSEPERLAVARQALAKREYNVALDLLKTYVANNAGGAEVDQAVYLLGQTYLGMKEYASAAVEFERLLRDYPESDSSGSGAFRLGEAYWGQSRSADYDQEFTIKAIEQWQSYRRGYPGHWLNAEAERRAGEGRARLASKLERTATLYLKLGRYEPSKRYFERIRNEFADTPQIADAELGLALVARKEGRREEAIATFREVEAHWPGHKVAARAARERARLEKKK